MVSVKDIAWLAGLLEGEGSFSPRKGGYLQIQLGMTDKDVVQRAAELMQTTLYGPYVQKARKKDGHQKKQYWQIRVGQNKGAAWMMTLYPLLGERRQAMIRASLAMWKTKRNYVTREFATCHPDRPHNARGLCGACYQRWSYRRIKKGTDAHFTT